MVQYADNTYKFVAVLNGKIETSRLFNALGHMTAGLVGQCTDNAFMRFLQYVDGSNTLHPAISQYPFIILEAKNSNQIRTLRQAAIQQKLLYNDFADSMLGTSSQNQLDQTKAAQESDLTYFGICLFGDAQVLNELTRKFSLFK